MCRRGSGHVMSLSGPASTSGHTVRLSGNPNPVRSTGRASCLQVGIKGIKGIKARPSSPSDCHVTEAWPHRNGVSLELLLLSARGLLNCRNISDHPSSPKTTTRLARQGAEQGVSKTCRRAGIEDPDPVWGEQRRRTGHRRETQTKSHKLAKELQSLRGCSPPQSLASLIHHRP